MSKKMIIHRDVYISIGMIVFSGIVFISSLSIQGEGAYLPKALLAFMAIMGVIVFANGWKMSKKATAASSAFTYDLGKDNLLIPLTVYGLIVAYLIMFQFLGYFFATTVFLIATLRYLRSGSWKSTIIITAVFVIVSYITFVKLLNVPIYRVGLLGPLFNF